MFAMVMIALIICFLLVLIVSIFAFVSVAFADPAELKKVGKAKAIRSALDTIHDVKVDADDPSSGTYGELIEQELASRSDKIRS
jgi:hypothetical protein